MKRFTMITFMLLAAVGLEAHSRGNMCVDLTAKLSKTWQRPIPCYCEKALSNLEITPPRGLRVDAVCGLRDASGRWIDLNKEKASLDQYDKNGGMPMGEVYLSGQITLTGTAVMEPSNSGDLSFGTKCNVSPEPAFLRNFCEFKLGSNADYKKIRWSKAVQ